MEGLIKGLLNTALDAASSIIQEGSSSENTKKDSSDDGGDNAHSRPEIIDRSSWAQIAAGGGGGGGQGEDHHKGSSYAQKVSNHPQHNQPPNAWNSHQEGQHTRPSRPGLSSSLYKDQVLKNQCESFKRPSQQQDYAHNVDESVNTDPTQAELQDLSAACDRLWELDLNRLTPGQHYSINCGEGKKVYQREDMADNALFTFVNRDVFRKPTYARFFSLLDNYCANQGVQEKVTEEERQEESAFVEEISRTAPIQYLFKYLVAKKMIPNNLREFKQTLKSLWFQLYGRGGTRGSSSSFEHVFVGEVQSSHESQVSGFHNWIKFYMEEANGRLDYQGFILPRKRYGSWPDTETQLLSVQFEWNGVLKPVSSVFIGVSPEFEIALYTLCFFVGNEDNYVNVGPFDVNIKCYRHGQNGIGSAFPIAGDC